MASTPDGPRYVSSLQKPNDAVCYKDFFETETLKDAKVQAEKAAIKANRKALVFDRKEHDIIYRFVPESFVEPESKFKPTEVRAASPLSRKSKKVEPPPEDAPKKPKKAPPKKKEVKKSKSSKYFE